MRKIMGRMIWLLCLITLLAGCGQKPQDEVVTSASYPDYSLGLNDSGMYQGIWALDYVTLPQGYDSIVYPPEILEVSQERCQARLEEGMTSLAKREQILDRAVAEGDMVHAAYRGSMDGDAFGNTEDLAWGISDMIDQIMDHLVGMMPGEETEFDITYPELYQPNPALSGKTVHFSVEIHYICGELIYPELTDALAETHFGEQYECTTIAELETAICEELRQSQMEDYVLEWLFENADCKKIPDQLIEDQFTILQQELCYYAAYYNINYGMNLTMNAMVASDYGPEYGAATFLELKQTMEPEMKESVRQKLILQAVAEEQGITVTGQDVAAYSEYMEQAGQGYVYQTVLNHKVYLYLFEHAGFAQ